MPVKDFTKEFKQLCQTYDKALKDAHTTNFKGFTNCMEYMVTYLKQFVFLSVFIMCILSSSLDDKCQD